MSFTYESSLDVAYLKYTTNKIVKTVEFNENINIDFDSDDKMVGVEVIGVSEYLKEKRAIRKLTVKRLAKIQGILIQRFGEKCPSFAF